MSIMKKRCIAIYIILLTALMLAGCSGAGGGKWGIQPGPLEARIMREQQVLPPGRTTGPAFLIAILSGMSCISGWKIGSGTGKPASGMPADPAAGI